MMSEEEGQQESVEQLSSVPTRNGGASVPQNDEAKSRSFAFEKADDKDDGWNKLRVAMKKNSPLAEIGALLKENPEYARETSWDKKQTLLFIGLEGRANEDSILAVLEAYPGAASIPETERRLLPLHMATMAGSSYKLIKAIYEAHPRATQAKTVTSYTPLHMAMRNKNDLRSILLILEAYPMAAQLKNNVGETPLHVGMKYKAPYDAVRAVLDAYPEATNIKAADGFNPLHYGIKHVTEKETILLLLDANPQTVTQKTWKNRTSLHLAMKFLRTPDVACEIVQRLIQANPRVTKVKDKSMKTPLHYGMEHMAPESAIKVVLEANPEATSAVDAEGNTPLHLGLKRGQPTSVIRLLLDACPDSAGTVNERDQTPLHKGIGQWAAEEVLFPVFETHPVSASMKDSLGMTPLHSIARAPSDYRELMKAIVERYPIALQTPSSKNLLPLHEAANAGANFAVEFMLKAYPGAAKRLDDAGGVPLFRFIERLSRGGRRRLDRTSGNLRDFVAVDTKTIEMLYKANPMAAETICENGASPLTILIALCARAKSFEELIRLETCRRIQILSSGLRDGQALRTLCTLQNPVALRAFFTIFDECNDLKERTMDFVPYVDFNKPILPGWTLLEMITDFYIEDSAAIVLQIVKDQVDVLMGQSNHRRLQIKARGTDIDVDIVGAIKESILTRVADRAKLSFGTPELKRWGQEYGRFLRRYRIEEVPKHISETCVVVFGTEAREGADGRMHEARVALKFMCDKVAFQSEIEKRKSSNQHFLMPIRACFARDETMDIDISDLDYYEFGVDVAFELKTLKSKIRLKSSIHSPPFQLKYLIVMESGAGVDLHDYISHQNIAGRDLHVVISIAKEVARCLQFLNEKCGIVHGDVKARNFVARGVGLEFAAIDLDNSASIIDKEELGHKRTSSGYLPPEQAVVEGGLRSSMSRDAPTVSQEDLMKQIQEASAAGNFAEVLRLSKVLEQAQNHIESQHQICGVVASSKYDMWCFGALLYYMCTGKHLFNVDTREEVEDDELRQLCQWTDKTKAAKLRRVQDTWPKALIEELLEKDPTNRPSSWQYIIDSLNFSGSMRLLNVQPLSASQEIRGLFDRLMVFQSAPLMYVESHGGTRHPMRFLNFEREVHVLQESLKDASTIGANIDIVFETATIDRFSAFFAQRTSRVMHLSCHGHRDYLALEDGFGGMQRLLVDDLKRLISKGGRNLQVVFVSACHSAKTGQAFVDAGVPHVVCCRFDEQFRDSGAIEFAKNFYRNLACQINLKEAFSMAQEAVRLSAVVEDPENEADKFLLLPQTKPDDTYHDVKVFYTKDVPPYSGDKGFNKDLLNRVQRLPEFLVGRELVIYRILECINGEADVIRLEGEPGIGRTCVAAAVCRYMLQRPKSFPMDFFAWLPQRSDLAAVQERLYDDLSDMLRLAVRGLDGRSNLAYTSQEAWRRIVSSMSGTRVTLLVDLRCFTRIDFLSFESFIRDLLNIAIVKILVISPNANRGVGFQANLWALPRHNKRQISIAIPPLDFFATALLFGWHSPYISRRNPDPALWKEYAAKLACSLSAEEQEEILGEMGKGNPSRIQDAARTMSEVEFQRLIRWSNHDN